MHQRRFSELNQTTLSSARWADVNKPEWLGNVLIIAADTTDTSPEDSFKIQQLKVCVSTTNSVCNIALNDASYNNTGAGIALDQDSKAVTGDLVTLLGMQAYQSDFFD